MYDNSQQVPYFQYPSTDNYGSSVYNNQYQPMQNVDNSYAMQQQQPPAYNTLFQQPTPMYATTYQQPVATYSTPVQQQQQQQQLQPSNVNQNAGQNSSSTKPPFSKGYKWPRKPVPLVCPICGSSVTTRVSTEITPITIVGTCLLCFFAFLFALIVCFLPPCKKTTHHCPHCKNILGIRPPLR